MMNLKNYAVILTFILISIKVNGQDTLTSATVEQKSYQLYTDKNWNELIKFGTNAISKGYNYYYLQLRVGIAYYEKKNYALAEGYFFNALKFNTDDELLLEYIYYCYLFNGKYDEARIWSKKFSPYLAARIGTDKQSSVSLLLFEGGSKITDQSGYYNEVTKTNSNYFNPPVYFQFGLNHYIKNRVSLFHALTYFNQETFINKVSQLQYFLKLSIPIKHGWNLSSSVHLIHIKTTTEVKTLPKQQVPGTGPPKKPETTIYITQSNYVVASLMAQKTIKKYTFAIGSSLSNMNSKTQFIHSGVLSYAPFGNSKLVLGCSGYVHTIDSYQTTCGAIVPFVYYQPFNKLSLKLSYLYNEKNNFIEENGYLVNNSADLTKSRYSALVSFSVNNRIALYGLYQLENKLENVQLFNYKYNVIVAGIKIIPFKK